VMGGTTDPITSALKESYAENADLRDALRIAVAALRAGSADAPNGDQSSLEVASLEVAILDASRPRRAFRRINRTTLENLLQERDSKHSKSDGEADGEASELDGESPE
jgi:proteasome alpha subunit